MVYSKDVIAFFCEHCNRKFWDEESATYHEKVLCPKLLESKTAPPVDEKEVLLANPLIEDHHKHRAVRYAETAGRIPD